MSNGNDKQQPGPPNQVGPIKVKSLHFLVPGGVTVSALRSCEGTTPALYSGPHRRGWTTEIVYEPWLRRHRVTETEENPDGKWAKVRTCYIPESAASYVPEVP